METKYGYSDPPHNSRTGCDHGRVSSDITNVDVRQCALKPCLYRNECRWAPASAVSRTTISPQSRTTASPQSRTTASPQSYTTASPQSCTTASPQSCNTISSQSGTPISPQNQFQHWAVCHRDKSALWKERRTCPVLWCRKEFDNAEQMLDHVSCCDLLPDGEYWCHEHQAPERFASVRVSRLLRSLSSRAWPCKQTPTKDPEGALWKKTKRSIRSLGPGSPHKSTGSSTLPLSDRAMKRGLNGLVTEGHRAPEYPELAGTQVYELGTGSQHKSTYLPSPFLFEPTMEQRLNGLVTEGHLAPEYPELAGTQVYELGMGSQHRSTYLPSSFLFEPTMEQRLNGLVTEGHLAPEYPELAGTQVYELGTGSQHKSTYLPSSFLFEPTMEQRLNRLVTEGHLAPEHPEFDGTEVVTQVYDLGQGSRHKSTCLSCSFPFDTAIKQGLNGHATKGHLAPDPDVLELPTATGTGADPYLTVSPVELMAADPTAIPPRQPNNNSLLSGNNSPQSSSPVSQICSPSSTSSDQKSRDINYHDVSHPNRSLDSLQSAYSVCTSTRPFRRSSVEFGQPATEQQIERSGPYSHHFAVPASSAPDYRPPAPRHLDGVIAAEQNDPTVTSLSQSRLEDGYAHLAEEYPQPSLLPRVNGCTTLNPLSNATSEIGPSKLCPSDLQVTLPEVYQGKPTSFEETPETFYPIECFDKTLSQDQEAFISIIAGTEKRLTAGELHSLAEVEIDLRTGAETHRHGSQHPYTTSLKAVNDASTNSGLLLDTHSSYYTDSLGLLLPVLQNLIASEDNDENRADEKKAEEIDGGWRAEGHMQQPSRQIVTNFVNTSPYRNSPTSTVSPALSCPTDSGYGTSSPVGSANLCSPLDTPIRQGNSLGLKRRRYDGTKPPPRDASRKALVPAAPIELHSTSQQDQADPDYLKCEFMGCGAKFRGAIRNQQSNLRKHNRTVHAPNPVEWHCPEEDCEAKCGRRDNLRSHLRTFHGSNCTDVEMEKHKRKRST